jgi:hypothetical protein
MASSIINQVASKLGGALGLAAAAAIAAVLTKKTPGQPFADLRFPADLNDKYYMSLSFSEYKRTDLLKAGGGTALGNIYLPIPNNLSDTFSVSYDTEPVGTALGAGVDAVTGLKQGQSLLSAGTSLTAGIAAGAISKVSDSYKAVGSAFLGETTNPFMTVLFKNPNYKEYSFSWRMYPRNQNDMLELLYIVRQIKYNMLPSKVSGSGGAILSYPSLVQCMINTPPGELYPFKTAVIKNATINYGPDGVPSFHKDGQPSAVDLKIDIQEVEYFLREDII